MLKNDGVDAVDILNCRHEEADTRLIFHANHATNSGHKNVVLVADDTDVMIIGVAHATEISGTVFQKKGKSESFTVDLPMFLDQKQLHYLVFMCLLDVTV